MKILKRLLCWIWRHEVETKQWRMNCSRCGKDFGDYKRFFETQKKESGKK